MKTHCNQCLDNRWNLLFFFINGILHISAVDSTFTNKLHLFTPILVLTLISSVHSLSCVRLFATPWTVACQASLSITNPRSLLRLMSIELVIPSNHLILCHPLSCLQSFPTSGSFQMSQLFTSGSQSIGISASAPVLPMEKAMANQYSCLENPMNSMNLIYFSSVQFSHSVVSNSLRQ